MNQFKPIISHQEGQNLFPGIPTVIKGDKAATHITMKNTKPQIALTPYGASYMSPGQDYAFAGNTVVELPTAQMGGQEEDSEAQIMQILQIYAQMKQIPIQQLIQQIQNLSEEEQQQSITAIAQEVQQVMQEQQQQQMAQQQMPMGQEEMGMAEEEMPMAQAGQEKRTEYMEKNPQGYYDYYKSTNTPEGPRYYKGTSPNMSFAQTMANFKAANNPADSTVYSTMPPNVQAAFKEDGGELCFDCYDHYNPFPQAQNLNWFYKAQGGEAFPQAQNLNSYYKAQVGKQVFTPSNYVAPRESTDTIYTPYQKSDPNAKSQYLRDPFADYAGSIALGLSPLDTPADIISAINDLKNERYDKVALSGLGAMIPGVSALTLKTLYDDLGDFVTDKYKKHLEERSKNRRSSNKKAQGGEAFPQAQTYLPYDRGNKPKPNFMFLEGGTTDIDQAYQVMKRGGMDFNPKKKRGGKFTQDSFQEYVMKNGGYLPKHQSTGKVLGVPNSYSEGIYSDWYDSIINNKERALWGFPNGTWYNENDNTMVSPEKFKQDYPDLDPFNTDLQSDVFDKNDQLMNKRADADADLYWSNSAGKELNSDPENKSNIANAGPTDATSNNTATNNTTSNDIPTGDVATPAASDSTNWRDVYRQSQKKMRQNNRGTAMRYPGQTQFLKASVGTTPRRSNVLGPALGAALRAADFGSGMTTGREIFGRDGGSMPLPKHQFTTATVGQNLSQPSGSYNTWGSPTIPAAVSESPAFQQMQDYNANATRIADQNVVSQGTDKLGDKPYSANSKRGFGFNTPYAARMVSNLEGIGNFLTGINELKAEDKIREKMPLSSAWMPVQQSTNRGNYMMNTGMFRPDSYAYAQSGPGMQSDQAFYAQTGGPLDMFEDGEVYDLDENTINMILAMGGSVEYL